MIHIHAFPEAIVKRGYGHPLGRKNKTNITPPVDVGGEEKYGRGCPHGSKNKPRVNPGVPREEAVKGHNCAPTPQVLRTQGHVAPTGRSHVLFPPPGYPPKDVQLEVRRSEFFFFVNEQALERLKLPEAFAKVTGEQEPDHAFLKKSSKGQGTWRISVYFDGDGCMFFTDGWKEFSFAYNLGFLLTFHHCQGHVAPTDRSQVLFPPPGYPPKDVQLEVQSSKFFVFVNEQALERLKLPEAFAKVTGEQEPTMPF
ncbi:hypothetical protein QYE76_024410 [Lolium multiflorum]|uniref:TF-B3 domain-containing protein n=1 Tax=Lolium multiflorum TaxID=4521 RepID=A0AAD8RC22_LOLMU|nr:hypothetical protein QYE76_024410 [Lolium multiflorum]